MTNADITRLLIQPRKHYVGARMQQGRVVLDSDFNEEAELVDEERRRALADIVGPTGSPDEGFAADSTSATRSRFNRSRSTGSRRSTR